MMEEFILSNIICNLSLFRLANAQHIY